MNHRAAALTCLLLVGGSVAADEPWELWEELLPTDAPLRTRLIERDSSAEACQSRARQLSETAPPKSVLRLGYTCLPGRPPGRPTT